ncbi:FAD/NAD(P)-binding domain-containing protein [Arthrobacter sp. MYb227]|uniref:FAD/NAD(P)-binding protein n=1 Tax=Arthrobacter sp. MYb227 TaxID=1848601 RepID=UPI0015E2A42A|nr:FAD/NAD(P)-binding protein [Arthrobacter sp. MYb227]
MGRLSNLAGFPQHHTPTTVLFVGGGPRAALVLERLIANRNAGPQPPLQVHLVDPYPVGAGRIWRTEQSGLLKLNSMAMDVSMFTDESVQCAGPPIPGPSLWEWVCQLRAGSHRQSAAAIRADTPELLTEITALRADSFPTRRLQSHYLQWFFERIIATKDPHLHVEFHRDTVSNILESDIGDRHLIEVASGQHLSADIVLLAQGHVEARPNSVSLALEAAAAKDPERLTYIPPAYTTDSDFTKLKPGQDVLVSGMGLAFVDLFVLLTEGRGGCFDRQADGTLRYVPSGREPRLLVGSRRGVPYRSKIRGSLQGTTGAGQRFLTRQAIEELLLSHSLLDFRAHLWPLVAKDAAYSYYRELFTAHPHRVTLSWEEFEEGFARVDWYSRERSDLEILAIPEARYRLDFEALDHPFATTRFTDATHIHETIVQHIDSDLRLRDSGEHSETLGLFMGLLGSYMALGQVVKLDELTPTGRVDLSGWWHGFFSYVDSGPPADRLHQLLALERVGLIRFLGPDVRFGFNEQSGKFAAVTAYGGDPVSAHALVEARLPTPSLATTADPLLAALSRRGIISQESSDSTKIRVDACHRIIDRAGKTRPWLFAVGAGVAGFSAGAFSRPHSNAAPFRDSDALAREILSAVSQAGAQLEPTMRPESHAVFSRAPQLSAIALLASLDSVHRYLG